MNSKKTSIEIEQSNDTIKKRGQQKTLVVVLENLRSGLNVGNIFRSSDAFGIHKIYCTGYTVTPPHREVLKGALGATESVAWAQHDDPINLIHTLKNEGYHCIAIEQTAQSQMLNEWPMDQDRIAVVFGNEVDGVSQAMIDACHEAVELPQMGIKHSLNVSVCAGIVLYTIKMAR